jgi:serine protease
MKKKHLKYVPFIGLATAISLSASAAVVEHKPTDQIIINFSSANVDGRSKASALSGRINKKLAFVRKTSQGSYVFKLPAREDFASLKNYLKVLKAVSGIKHAEADQMMFAIGDLTIPPVEGTVGARQKPIYDLQWHYHESTGGMNAEGAWSQLNSSDPVVNVAVLDTGITAHPDLDDHIIGGADMITATSVSNDGDGRDADPSDPGDWITKSECYFGSPASNSSWHGTHVTGTISASTNNTAGIAGVGYNLLKVVPVRILGKCGGYTSDIADAVVWAATGVDNPNKAKVINMSLGGGGSCSATYQNAINTAVAAGTTVVVAAGNSNADAGNYTPASCDNVISVASTGRTGGRAYYSNYGTSVDLAAPGGETNAGSKNGVLSALNEGTTSPAAPTYAYYQGTSMAAPHVAAVAGLLYVKKPNITPAEVEEVLTSTARAFPATCNQCGTGILDAGAAIAALDGSTTPTVPDAPSNFTVQAGNGVVNISWSDQSDNETSFYIERRREYPRQWSAFRSEVTTAADATSHQDSVVGGTYQYRIRAQNSAGISAWVISSEVSVTSSN